VLCIETCGQSIERIAAANQTAPQLASIALSPAAGHASRPDPLAPHDFSGQAESVSQLAADNPDFPFSLDIPWDHLWDDLSEPWHLPDQP